MMEEIIQTEKCEEVKSEMMEEMVPVPPPPPPMMEDISKEGKLETLRSGSDSWPREKMEKYGDMMVLCLLTRFRFVGVDVTRLPQQNELDWGSIVPAPFEFNVDLDIDLQESLRSFVLDSNVYMTGYTKIYGFDLNKNPVLREADPKLVPPPENIETSFVTNILGDTYILSPDRSSYLLYVLDSKVKQWVTLPPPPPPLGLQLRGGHGECFVLHHKLYLKWHANPQPIQCFDPKSKLWTQEHYKDDKNHLLNNFCFEVDGQPEFFSPQITLSLSDGNIILASPDIGVRDNNRCRWLSRVIIYAFLDNQQEQGVLVSQPLEEVLEGIHPAFVDFPQCFLIDLGNSMVGALLCGRPLERNIGPGSLICLSVFTLAKIKHADGRFLSVDVLAKHVFTLTDVHGPLLEAFIWRNRKSSSKKEKHADSNRSYPSLWTCSASNLTGDKKRKKTYG